MAGVLVTPPRRRPSRDDSILSEDSSDLPFRLRESPSIFNTPTSVTSIVDLSPQSFLRGKSVKTNQIGSSWSVEMANLKQSGSGFEAIMCLRQIRNLLDEIDHRDRLKFCKADFEQAFIALKKQKSLWSGQIASEVVTMLNRYFNESPFEKLPTCLIQEILMWLPIDDFAPVPRVNKEWHVLGSSDEIWQTFYRYKFLRHGTNSMPPELKSNFVEAFRRRLADPALGDKVEVAWRGKFRLEAVDVYQGLAWWVAEVVDKHATQGKYKIRYPGWESRWDEWVPRSRLRWAVDRNVVAKLQANDVVELWCCGANVPGAWLESKVKKVRGNKYCVGRVLSSGPLWVDRDRLRLAKSSYSSAGDNAISEGSSSRRIDISSTRRNSGAGALISAVSNSMTENINGQSCLIM